MVSSNDIFRSLIDFKGAWNAVFRLLKNMVGFTLLFILIRKKLFIV